MVWINRSHPVEPRRHLVPALERQQDQRVVHRGQRVPAPSASRRHRGRTIEPLESLFDAVLASQAEAEKVLGANLSEARAGLLGGSQRFLRPLGAPGPVELHDSEEGKLVVSVGQLRTGPEGLEHADSELKLVFGLGMPEPRIVRRGQGHAHAGGFDALAGALEKPHSL